MKHKGTFKLKQYRNGTLIAERTAKNATTEIGAQTVLNSIFRNIAHPTSWFIGLIDNTGFTAFDLEDAMDDHPGWVEFTDYGGDRKQYNADPATGRKIENEALPACFNFNGLAIIQAVFLVSDATKECKDRFPGSIRYWTTGRSHSSKVSSIWIGKEI